MIDKIIAGLNIFKKYCPDVGIDHDVMYAGYMDTKYTEEEIKILKENGWRECREFDCWMLPI